MATAVATTSADRASASEIRPSETVIEHVTLNIVSHVDMTEFLRVAKQTYKAHE